MSYCELDFTTPLELTVATILSAQSTDKRVNLTTPALFAPLSHRGGLRAGRPRRTRNPHSPHRFLPQQGGVVDRPRAGIGRAVRRRGAGDHGRAGDAARGGTQDRQRHPGQRIRHPGNHRRHPFRAAGSALALDGRGGPGQGRACGRRTHRTQRVDGAESPGDLPRSPGLPRPQTGVRGVRVGQGLSRRSAPGPPSR